MARKLRDKYQIFGNVLKLISVHEQGMPLRDVNKFINWGYAYLELLQAGKYIVIKNGACIIQDRGQRIVDKLNLVEGPEFLHPSKRGVLEALTIDHQDGRLTERVVPKEFRYYGGNSPTTDAYIQLIQILGEAGKPFSKVKSVVGGNVVLVARKYRDLERWGFVHREFGDPYSTGTLHQTAKGRDLDKRIDEMNLTFVPTIPLRLDIMAN